MDSEPQREFVRSVLSVDQSQDELRAWLQTGIDVNVRDELGYTALHSSAMADWNEDEDGRMRILLEAGADTEARAETQAIKSCTPLALAAAEGYAAQVRRLVEYGADVNAVDACSMTPLMHALSSGFQVVDKVEALLGGGADAQMKDRQGRTALDHARESRRIWTRITPEAMDRIQDDRQPWLAQQLADLADVELAGQAPELLAAKTRYDSEKAVQGMRSELERAIDLLEKRDAR
jgi:hypothetical protein